MKPPPRPAGPAGAPEQTDVDSPAYWVITPDELADAVVHVIDQPWGISISDITVRASGEDYIR